MLKNDIEKTLQAHSPVPPEGFAEFVFAARGNGAFIINFDSGVAEGECGLICVAFNSAGKADVFSEKKQTFSHVSAPDRLRSDGG